MVISGEDKWYFAVKAGFERTIFEMRCINDIEMHFGKCFRKKKYV